jgi:hypothetical protein
LALPVTGLIVLCLSPDVFRYATIMSWATWRSDCGMLSYVLVLGESIECVRPVQSGFSVSQGFVLGETGMWRDIPTELGIDGYIL